MRAQQQQLAFCPSTQANWCVQYARLTSQFPDDHETPHGAGELPATRAQGFRETVCTADSEGDLSISVSLAHMRGSELQSTFANTLLGGIPSVPK